MDSDFNIPDYETEVECPYNPAHRIIKHRLQKHLVSLFTTHVSCFQIKTRHRFFNKQYFTTFFVVVSYFGAQNSVKMFEINV